MKPKKILLPLIFAAFSLSGCDLGGNKSTVIPTNPRDDIKEVNTDVDPVDPAYPDDPVDPVNPVDPVDPVETVVDRETLLSRYQPESLRGFDNVAQFTFNAYYAHVYANEKHRVYSPDTSYGPDQEEYTFDIDEDGDGVNDFIGYQIHEQQSYSFECFTYFDFDASDCDFIKNKIGLGRIEALVVKDHFFGEIMLILKNGNNYFACAEVSVRDNTLIFGVYKHYNHFFMCKDSKVKDEKIAVTFDGGFYNHTTVSTIKFSEKEFDVISDSVLVDNSSIVVTREEQIDYLNECRRNSVLPSSFIKYRLPEYKGSSFTYRCDSNPQAIDPECKDLLYIECSNSTDISDYIGQMMNDCGFTYFSYNDEVCFKKAYDMNYDLYLLVWYDPTVIRIKAYLVPYMKISTVQPDYSFPRNVNGLYFPVEYATQNATFYIKTIKEYQYVFIYGTTDSEFESFYNDLVAFGMTPNLNSLYCLTFEDGTGIYDINMNNLEVVPYRYIGVKQVG